MLLTREVLEKREREILAGYASFSADANREFPDSGDDFRTQFQRDHARIIHSKAFRRLRGKTQVFVAHHGDHYRNRLSHTLEVAQISRNLARNLGVNEDLSEAIALAHDLGHTPFGHAGEGKLNELMGEFGKRFEHNLQSRRILEKLEKKYVDFEGLNLTLDLLDGLAKHSTPYDSPSQDSSTPSQPSLEAQVVNLSDEIAYTNHDIDDGLRGKILHKEDLVSLDLWKQALEKVDTKLPNEAFNHRAVSALINLLTRDLLHTTSSNLEKSGVKTLEDVKNFPNALVSFSPQTQKGVEEMRVFLREKFYFHPSVKELSEKGEAILEKIFRALIANPSLLNEEFHERLESDAKEVVVKDFVSGMSDNFAIEFAKKLV